MPEEATTGPENPSVEAEFSNLIRSLDLYVRQKTDLYIQHYLLDPLDFILKQVILLSAVASLIVVGIISIAVGIVLLISSMIPLWATLLICGLAALLLTLGLAYFMFGRRLVLKTPKSAEDL